MKTIIELLKGIYASRYRLAHGDSKDKQSMTIRDSVKKMAYRTGLCSYGSIRLSVRLKILAVSNLTDR